jgi:hypothetical protein
MLYYTLVSVGGLQSQVHTTKWGAHRLAACDAATWHVVQHHPRGAPLPSVRLRPASVPAVCAKPPLKLLASGGPRWHCGLLQVGDSVRSACACVVDSQVAVVGTVVGAYTDPASLVSIECRSAAAL